jgi:hypothetical protein
VEPRTPHIVVDLKEQLGNQLFQYAAAKQLELDGAKVVFSDRTKREAGAPMGGLKRLEELTGTTLPLASTWQELATGYLPRTVFTSTFVDFVLSSPIVLPSIRRIQPTRDYDPKPLIMPKRSLYRLQGYFQHRTWFDRSLASVLASLELATRDWRTQLPSFDFSVHLRRGDYVSHGWELSLDYYVRALESLPPHINSVVVTSDDQLAALTFSHYLKSKGYDSFVAREVDSSSQSSVPRHVDPVLYDFCLMTNANNVIMSNSSFCWWATALGDSLHQGSNERAVAYPRGWVRHLDDDRDGLVQPTWKQISQT